MFIEVVNITIDQLYRNLVETTIDSVLDSKKFSDRYSAHQNIARYSLGILQVDIPVIKDAFKRGYTASLLPVEDMRRLEDANKLEKNYQVNIFSDEKLIISLVNQEIVW